MSAVENIRAALADATNGPWIGAGPSFGAPHAEYLDSVVEDVDNDDAATICRDTETGDARYIAACNPAAMAEVLAHIDRQAAEIAGLEADAARYQWLRKTTNYATSNGEKVDVRNFPELWDASIDSMIAETPKEQP